MPTGITYIIDEKDAKPAEFLWNCARQFGFMAHMRDERGDAEITPPPADTYYRDALKAAQDDLSRVQALSEQEIIAESKEDFDEKLDRWTTNSRKQEEVWNRYEAMRVKVSEWTPPQGLEGVKRLALEQLEVGKPYVDRDQRPVPVPHSDFQAARVARLIGNVQRFEQEEKKEAERHSERLAMFNAFKRAMDSL